MSNLLSFCLLFARATSSGFCQVYWKNATDQRVVFASGFQQQCHTPLSPASPSSDISIPVKGKCIRKGVFHCGCRSEAQRRCQGLRAELYLTGCAQPPWSSWSSSRGTGPHLSIHLGPVSPCLFPYLILLYSFFFYFPYSRKETRPLFF